MIRLHVLDAILCSSGVMPHFVRKSRNEVFHTSHIDLSKAKRMLNIEVVWSLLRVVWDVSEVWIIKS